MFFYIRNKIEIKYPALEFSLTEYCVLSTLRGNYPPSVSHSFYWFYNFCSLLTRTVTSGPNGRADRPWAALPGHGWRLGYRRACCRALALPLSGCCGACWHRAPAVTAAAVPRARAASAAGQVGAGRPAGALLPRSVFWRVPGLERWIPAVTSCLPALPPRRLRPGPP